MLCFQYLDQLPKVPEDLLLDLDLIDCGPASFASARQRILYKKGCNIMAGVNRRDDLTKSLEQWIQHNIITEWQNIGLSITTGPCHGPHIDRSRFYTLQYLLRPGGPDTVTVFYEPVGQKLDLEPGYFWFNNYDQLLETGRHQFDCHRWILLDARNNIHSVENIQTPRFSLQIGLMKVPDFASVTR